MYTAFLSWTLAHSYWCENHFQEPTVLSWNPSVPSALLPVPISLKTTAFPSCVITDDKLNESILQNRMPTIIYYEYHICIALLHHYLIWSSLSMSLCSMRKWNNYFRDEETRLHKIRFVPKAQRSWRRCQDANLGFKIPHPELCSFIQRGLSYVKCLVRH